MKNIKEILKKYGANTPPLELSLILAKAINKSKEFVYTNLEYKLNLIQYYRFNYYLYLIQKNYPLSYITKHKEFFNLDFLVNKHVLIPRPDTEIMVELVINDLKKIIDKKTLLIDVGTGSGCIAISIKKNIDKINKQSLDVMASDFSKPALKMAQKNAWRQQTKIEFYLSDLLDFIKKRKKLKEKWKKYETIIITANLPYLTAKQYNSEKSIQSEPRLALFSKNKGLEHYTRLLEQIKEVPFLINKPLMIFLEIDPTQTIKIKQIIKNIFTKSKIDIYQDLAKRDRVVKINLSPEMI